MLLELSQGQVDSFGKHGYVLLENFFTASELSSLEEAVRHAIRAFLAKAELQSPGINASIGEGEEFDAGIAALESVDHSFVAQIYDTLSAMPALQRLLLRPELEHAANRLLGRAVDAPCYTFTGRLRIDPPEDDRRTYGWHQEVYYTIPESNFVQVWAPMIRGTTIENGTIEICEGSHAEGIARSSWIEEPGRALQVVVDDAVIAKYPKRHVEMRLGDVLMFSGRMFHRSGHNSSEQVRYSLIGMFHDIDVIEFRPAAMSFSYPGLTPRAYFDRTQG